MEHKDIFTHGVLLRFEPFYFPDGGLPKPKYFIVLHKENNGALLASLPTSKDHVPNDVKQTTGCIELPERNFNAFIFPANTLVTSSFSFPLNTFVYGSNIHYYDSLKLMAPISGGLSKISVIGTILPKLFLDLLECLKSSSSVRRKYQKILRKQ